MVVVELEGGDARVFGVGVEEGLAMSAILGARLVTVEQASCIYCIYIHIATRKRCLGLARKVPTVASGAYEKRVTCLYSTSTQVTS